MRMVRILAAALSASTIAGAAVAADLPSRKAPPPAYVAPVPMFTWTGLYIGVNGGGFINNSRIGSFAGFGNSGKLGGGSYLVGGTIGYNWQTANGMVLGVEADADYRGKASETPPLFLNVNSNDGVLGSARVRLGYGFDRALIYVTGGLAFGNAIAPNALVSPFFGVAAARSGSNPTFGVGWTAGAGLEYALNNNWSVKGEYLYADLGSKSWVYNAGLVPVSVAGTSAAHELKAGVNYRFNFGGVPVYAKY
ncbi:MAG TPA: porin family protein [Rhodoblastus sp.]|nr:porin family protein [Rhodoblastus sp.]